MKRFLTILLLLLGIIGLSYYNYSIHPRADFLNKYGIDSIGSKVKLSYSKVLKISKDTIIAKDDNDTLQICYENSKFYNNRIPEINKHISSIAIYKGKNIFSAKYIYIHKYRNYKFYTSMIALTLVTILFFRKFRFNFKELVIKKR